MHLRPALLCSSVSQGHAGSQGWLASLRWPTHLRSRSRGRLCPGVSVLHSAKPDPDLPLTSQSVGEKLPLSNEGAASYEGVERCCGVFSDRRSGPGMTLSLLNFVALLVGTLFVGFMALGLLWRIGSWQIRPAASLILDEGLRIGTGAPEIAAHSGENDMHLSFMDGRPSSSWGAGDASRVRASSSQPPSTPPRDR